ncbi:MAG: hypothetical protein WCD37_13330 [Chloroflexia bacterium]
MTSRRTPSGSTRNTLSLALMVAGGLLLVLVPLLLVFLAVSGAQNVDLPGTLVILSVVGGMALVVLGEAIRA